MSLWNAIDEAFHPRGWWHDYDSYGPVTLMDGTVTTERYLRRRSRLTGPGWDYKLDTPKHAAWRFWEEDTRIM